MQQSSKNLVLGLDMYGCPNRCRHCWLGHLPNTKPPEDADKYIVDYFSSYFRSVTFYSWIREPDFCDDYRARWERDNLISVNAKPQRFELASFWRIVRDKCYVDFLKEVGVKTVQLSFFGMEETTDSYIGRRGAFRELLEATEILLANEIAPRWQVFLYENNVNEIVELLPLSQSLSIEERCREFGSKFVFFVHEGSCDGENAKLYEKRINKHSIPPELIPYYEGYGKIHSERELCEKYSVCHDYFIFHNEKDITLNITNNLDIYYNFTHISPEWRIGNLLTDNKEKLLEKIINEQIPPLKMARQTPICELIKMCGNDTSERVFKTKDYFQYLLNSYVVKKLHV